MSEARFVRSELETPELTKYDLLEEIGHGGMATVYRAVDRRLGREVAVKVIHRHLRESGEVAARFTSEARAVAMLRHPNIVEVYDVSDPDEDERYLVVELVRGTTLRKLLQTHGRLPPEIAIAVALEIASALDHAHSHGVVHRDVKPENVLVESVPADATEALARSLVKITDFGIAKLLDAQGVTSTGQVLGSPAHMAPEQIEGDSVTPRADVFALGVLLYESVVGALPFEGKNPAQVLRRVLEGKHVPADRARPSVGAQLSQILERTLARSPEDRPGSAAELARLLQQELDRVGFDRPREELTAFLRNPEAYLARYEPRIVSRLMEVGSQARSDRDVPLAAACFNRALAYRPDDPDLVRTVTGLAQAERARRTLLRVASATGFAIAALAAAYGIVRGVRSVGWWRDESAAGLRAGTRGASEPAAGPVGSGQVRLAPSSGAGSATVPDRPAPQPRPRVISAARAAPKSRDVAVIVKGAGGAQFTLDGLRTDWFGATFPLTVGRTYVFGFLPPAQDPDCCVGSSESVTIPDGPGRFVVEGKVGFKDAILDASRLPDRTSVSCGLHAQGAAPQRLTVRMEQAVFDLRCRLTTLDGAVREITVKLRPGRITDLTWQ